MRTNAPPARRTPQDVNFCRTEGPGRLIRERNLSLWTIGSVLAAQRDGANGAFDGVVVGFNTPVIKEEARDPTVQA